MASIEFGDRLGQHAQLCVAVPPGLAADAAIAAMQDGQAVDEWVTRLLIAEMNRRGMWDEPEPSTRTTVST